MKDGRYEVVKDIILQSGREMFKKGIIIYRTNGVYYTERGMLPPEYQDFLRDFMKEEEDLGWEYICPLKTSVAYQNEKEDLD